jgi:spore maturation protein CgeB
MSRPLDIAVIGLSLSSSWGNGHATTYRSLLRGLHRLGHRLLFLERDVPWYAEHRDLGNPAFCRLLYYDSVADLLSRFSRQLRSADVIVMGSYVPEGVAVIDNVAPLSTGQFCFYDIDTPVTIAKLNSGDDEYLSRRQVPQFDVYFSFTGGPTLQRLEAQFGARRAEALYCSVDAELYAPTGEAKDWDLGYLGTHSPDRQPTLQKLLIDVAGRMHDRRFVVAGPQYPSQVHWPANVERIDHLPPARHPSFYSRQKFTLNVTRSDMVAAGWSPSVRLFEAAACGTPIISDRWPGLTDLLAEGRAIRIVETTEDVCAILAGTSEAERQSLAQEARRLVASNHTGEARARDFIAALNRPSSTRSHDYPLSALTS